MYKCTNIKQSASFTVVRHNLEYANVTWDPNIKTLTTSRKYNDVQQHIKIKIDFKVKNGFKSS